MSNPQQPTPPTQPTPTPTTPVQTTATAPAAMPAVATVTLPIAFPQQSQEDHTNLSTRLAYFAIGGAVGALVALLFAPKPGRELRTDIADATRKGVDRTRETAHTLGAKAGDYYEVSKERAAELYSSASSKAGDVARTAREGAYRRGEQLTAAIEAGKQAYAEEKRRTQTFDQMESSPTYYDADDSMT